MRIPSSHNWTEELLLWSRRAKNFSILSTLVNVNKCKFVVTFLICCFKKYTILFNPFFITSLVDFSRFLAILMRLNLKNK